MSSAESTLEKRWVSVEWNETPGERRAVIWKWVQRGSVEVQEREPADRNLGASLKYFPLCESFALCPRSLVAEGNEEEGERD